MSEPPSASDSVPKPSLCLKNNILRWSERVFGLRLTDCSRVTETNNVNTEVQTLTNTGEVIGDQIETVGVYFSFANISAGCDELVEKLRQLHERLNESDGRRFEVVQVVLWAHTDVYNDFETSHRANLLNLPWFAVPFSEIELKTKLSRRYRIKSGVPTLVLLDKDGNTITPSAQDRLLEDPMGASFPWRPRPIDQVLRGIVLQPCGGYYDNQTTLATCEKNRNRDDDVSYDSFPEGGVRGLYFSANWCPPCRAFTPQLAEIYRVIRESNPNFEIVFVSSDRSGDSYNVYIETMPWLAVPYHQKSVRSELAQLYGIRGIPTLILLDGNGHLITMDGRSEISDDPLGKNFPWKPRAVNVLTERYVAKLHDYPSLVLFVDGEDTDLHFADSVLTPTAQHYYTTHNINVNAPSIEERSYCTSYYTDVATTPTGNCQPSSLDLVHSDISPSNHSNNGSSHSNNSSSHSNNGSSHSNNGSSNSNNSSNHSNNAVSHSNNVSNHSNNSGSHSNNMTSPSDGGVKPLFDGGVKQLCDGGGGGGGGNSECGAPYWQFLIALDDSDATELLRDLIPLDDVVPLLVAVDLPRGRYAVLEYGVEITVEAVRGFHERCLEGGVEYHTLCC